MGEVVSLQVIGFGAVGLLVPFDQEAGVIVQEHSLQVVGHGSSSSPYGSQTRRELPRHFFYLLCPLTEQSYLPHAHAQALVDTCVIHVSKM